EVRLTAPDGAAETADGPDRLALDDRSWAIVPPDRLRRILLVSEGDPYLETALSYLPNVELYGVAPDEYGPATRPELFDLIVFEGTLPATLPAKPILAIDPPRSSPLGEVTGRLAEPAIGALDPDEPVLRHVDLSTTHIAEARRMTLPAWARPIVPGPRGAPLLYAGVRAGLPSAVLAFDPRRSDLPLQVAFPILLANLTGELFGGSATPTEAIAPGAPVALRVPSGASGLRVTRPDGSEVELVAPAGDAAVTFSQTDLLGVYAVTPVGLAASPAPPASAAAPSTPGGTASLPPGASPAASAEPLPADPSAPVRFAVALLDVDESTIAPGSAAAIEALGRPRPAGGAGAAADRPAAREELWIPLVAVVLAVLLVEWAVYERDALERLRRRLADRLARRPVS
ncbi:MAG TPA: hypothetical protein VNJ28_00660, partial [Candidatus Limnocylindrales bacterium]|nr:hypothetical protein [Candidatus Limnocylindrales bacterium]